MSKVAISTDKAPKPVASYSQAVRKGNVLQVAGQVGIDPATGQLAGTTIAEQSRQIFTNLNAILAEAGASLADVIMVRVYLTDRADFAEFNELYAEFVGEPPFPARTTVYCGLAEGLVVEIDALAVLD